MLGRIVSPETKKKISEANKLGLNKLKERVSIPIYKICPITDCILQRYNSISEAGKDINIASSAISQTLLGRRKTSGGFKWKYVNNK